MKSVIMLSAVCAICAVSFAPAGRAETGALRPTELRCEYLVNPLGIDERAPRLSWTLESEVRAQRQTAYQVLVATSSAALGRGEGDLWDSGRVESDETASVVYAGKPLTTGLQCFWKVKVWDRDGRPSSWSPDAEWSMGLLEPSDWKAEWIGCDKFRSVEPSEMPFDGAKWIWHAPDPGTPPKCHRLFIGSFDLPAGASVEKAELMVAADDKCRLVINARNAASVGAWTQPARADIRDLLRPGGNQLRVEVENTGESPAGLLVRIVVQLRDGKTVTCMTDASWRSTDNPGANWHNRDIDTSGWPAAKVLGDYGMEPWGRLKTAAATLPPPIHLRTEFKAGKAVARATISATALGIFDLYLNGRRVSDDYFNPGWTAYDKRVLYRAYDVTGLIRRGDNALGAVLADGWYSGYVGYGRNRDHYGKQPRLLAQLHIEFADGTTETVATGPGWKAATGPLLEADFLMGETCDARLEPKGWDQAGFDDRAWEPVVTGTDLKPLLQAHRGPPVRAVAEFRARTVTEPQPGVYVLDLGQNFAGVARLKVKGEPGQKIVLRFAERLNPDGTIYTTNLRSARATDTYICRGGEETWTPRFTFHGFQYVEVSGLKGQPGEDEVVGIALSSDTPVAGSFACSDEMLNKLRSNIWWTQRANFIDIPTDCPQRDERLGWTGDAQVYVRTATLNADVQPFFTKWLVDLCEDGQRADGQFPMVAPVKVAGPDGGPAWADAGVICPWTIYEVYGDRRVLERHYAAMTRFIEFCRKRCTPDLLPPAQFHCFGDWLSIQADTPKEVIFTAYFAYSTKLTARAAGVLGKTEDATRYEALFEQIKAAFNKAYVDEAGRIKGDTQTCYVLAIAFDLLDPEKAKKAAEYLVADIEKRNGHLSTGFIGTKDLMLALAKIGRNDVAYRLLHNDTFPSWGFSIRHGASSIWERWDGWTPDKGFQDPGMNSFAHYSFGAVYQWMVENIGGIRSDGPAYKRIVIAPQPGGKLTSAKTGYRSLRGLIETEWTKTGDALSLSVTIPPNTTATVHVPARDEASVTESGKPAAKAEGVKFLRMEGGSAVFEVGSGAYRFASKGP
jgi:alpha-L-rhamnosidase